MGNFVILFSRAIGKLPAPLRRAARAVTSPRSPLYKIMLRVSGERAKPTPPPTELPRKERRVYIAPVNAAEQAKFWAQALEDNLPALGARNMMASVIGAGNFESGISVPLGAFHLSREWQKAEFEQAARFTHVLNESAQSMFGGLFHYDVIREVSALRKRRVSVAAIMHGSDVRNPAANAERTPWSPFHLDLDDTPLLQEIAEKNRAAVRRMDLPIFVSTPDLLDDLPEAYWCPLVIDQAPWANGAEPLLSGDMPIVTHIPSSSRHKGTQLIREPLDRLETAKVVEYRPLTGVPREQMPHRIGSADILLDQFGVGGYGAVSVEAMAAGRVVVAHVLPSVRAHIRHTTGLELPIVEANPDTLESVISELVTSPDLMREIGERGRAYAAAVHDGRMSAAALSEHWIDRT